MRKITLLLPLLLTVFASVLPAYADDQIGTISGDWNNQSGWNMHVVRDQFSGWDANLGCCGDGRITADTTKNGANIKLEGAGWECWFSANILADRKNMNWRFIDGSNSKCKTATGLFYLLAPPPSDTTGDIVAYVPTIGDRDTITKALNKLRIPYVLQDIQQTSSLSNTIECLPETPIGDIKRLATALLDGGAPIQLIEGGDKQRIQGHDLVVDMSRNNQFDLLDLDSPVLSIGEIDGLTGCPNGVLTAWGDEPGLHGFIKNECQLVSDEIFDRNDKAVYITYKDQETNKMIYPILYIATSAKTTPILDGHYRQVNFSKGQVIYYSLDNGDKGFKGPKKRGDIDINIKNNDTLRVEDTIVRFHPYLIGSDGDFTISFPGCG